MSAQVALHWEGVAQLHTYGTSRTDAIDISSTLVTLQNLAARGENARRGAKRGEQRGAKRGECGIEEG
jgi:hypothetical protein